MTEKLNGTAYEDNRLPGTPVVFIHGFPFGRAMWKPQVEALAAARRVVTYDVRGHGESDAGDGQYTIELFVDDLMALLDGLKIEKAVLCGLSMGGYVALRAAERHPGRVAALVLCDTKSEPDGNEAKLKRAKTMEAVKRHGVEKFAADFVKTVVGETTLKNHSAVVEAAAALIRGNKASGVAGTLLALAARTDTTPALASMDFPALLLVGAEDKLTPPAASEAMKRHLPNASLHVIPGAGHLSNLENAAAFNEKLLAFLDTVR